MVYTNHMDNVYITGTVKESHVADVHQALMGGSQEVNIYIHTYGGQADASRAIVEMIKGSNSLVRTHNLGVAYSAGSLIFLAGDERVMYPESELMIHRASCWDHGNAKKFSESTQRLEEFDKYAKKIYKKFFSKEIIERFWDGEDVYIKEKDIDSPKVVK